jgi:hypothetical protein
MDSRTNLGVLVGFRIEGQDLIEIRTHGEYRWHCSSFHEKAIQMDKIVDQIHRDAYLRGDVT